MEENWYHKFIGLVPGVEFRYPEENCFEFKSEDGTRLHTYKYPVENPKATAILFHGLGAHSNYLGYLAHLLTLHKVQVYAFDYKGFGKSDGKKFQIYDFHELIRDSQNFVNLVASHNPAQKIFLVGHSMGGAIAAYLSVSLELNIEGLVMSSPAFRENPPVRWWKKKFLAALRLVLPWLGVGGKKQTIRNADAYDYIDSDPYMQHDRISTRTVCAILYGFEFISNHVHLIDCPCLMVQGSDDDVTDPVFAKQMYERIKVKDKTLMWIENLGHSVCLEHEAHSILNQVADWVQERI